jgi:MATE family multidrug resistance protein
MLAPNPPRPGLWRRETSHLARSGLTLAFNQLLQIAIPFVTTSMTGRLGVDALAAGSLVGSIGLLLFISSLGVLQGLVPLVSIGIGAGDERATARAIRGGLAIAVAMGVGATAIMACVPWALAHTGQDPALVALAQRFILAMLPGYLPSIVAIALRFFLIAANDLKWLNPVIVTGIGFNIACNLWLGGGAFELDRLTAIGLTISLTNWLMFGLLTFAILRAKRIPQGVRDWRAGAAVRDALALGIPVGAIFFTETLLFTGSSVLMGYFGKVALAAHGIVLLWLNIALMMPIGVSQAAMARVAYLSGQRDVDALKHAVTVSLIVGIAASIAVGAVLVATSDHLVRLAMWSRPSGGDAVIVAARHFFYFCAVTQLLSGLIIVMASILRGLRDANAVLWLVMIGYWGVGLGGAILFAFGFGLGGTGIWLGITLAFVFAVILLTTRFSRVLARLRSVDQGADAA